MAQALAGNAKWLAEAHRIAMNLKQSEGPNWPFTGEDLRIEICLRTHLRPRHHNAWGGFINGLKIQGHLEEIREENRRMRTPLSHARATPTYRWRTA
jgi:hypothetical protein